MTERIDTTRRKPPGAAGAVGLSTAGAGLGTSALFGDQESFERNTLAAGDLDLRVDWQQTYDGPNPATGEVGLHGVNAYPDHDGDGWQSFNEIQYGGPGASASADEIPGVCCACAADEFQWGGPFGGSDITDWVAISSEHDAPIELDRTAPLTLTAGCSVRSGQELPVPDVFRSDASPEQDHLVELADVKPGDTGEITFSLHNCGNPGDLWLDLLNLTSGENGMTESEADTDDDGESELPRHVEVRLWYDRDCDNSLDGAEAQIYPNSGYETVANLFQEAGQPIDTDDDLDSEGRRIELDGQPDSGGGRDPIPGDGGTLCIGFEWRVPTDVGNVIQTDSLGFDIRYYTEQRRNNGGE